MNSDSEPSSTSASSGSSEDAHPLDAVLTQRRSATDAALDNQQQTNSQPNRKRPRPNNSPEPPIRISNSTESEDISSSSSSSDSDSQPESGQLIQIPLSSSPPPPSLQVVEDKEEDFDAMIAGATSSSETSSSDSDSESDSLVQEEEMKEADSGGNKQQQQEVEEAKPKTPKGVTLYDEGREPDRGHEEVQRLLRQPRYKLLHIKKTIITVLSLLKNTPKHNSHIFHQPIANFINPLHKTGISMKNTYQQAHAASNVAVQAT